MGVGIALLSRGISARPRPSRGLGVASYPDEPARSQIGLTDNQSMTGECLLGHSEQILHLILAKRPLWNQGDI